MSFIRSACPLLPEVAAPLDHRATRLHAPGKGMAFYLAALEYAQSLWRQGKPAQAILQLNKSLMADLRGDEAELRDWPPPYAALRWILEQRRAEDFIGNPVRHFQHLATRVSGERRELRSWRAWGCYYLSRSVLDEAEFPPDLEQVEKEGVVAPGWGEVLEMVGRLGWAGEDGVLGNAVEEEGSLGGFSRPQRFQR